MHHALEKENGVIVLETVIALPVLCLLLFGMVQLGFFFQGKIQLDYACYRGVRKAIVHLEEEDWSSLVHEQVKTHLPPLAQFDLEYQIDTTQVKIGDPITLHVAWDLPLMMPFSESIFQRQTFPLETECTLLAESGDYVAKN